MKTSLIIPTLNRLTDLTRCLTSITKLNQQFDEIIIVEQGDIEKTKQTIASFNQLNICLYFHPIQSAAQARNKGIEHAEGELLFFIDDDTQLKANHIEIAQQHLKHNPTVMGLTGPIISPHQANHHPNLLNHIYWWGNKIINILLLYSGVKMRVLKSGINTHSIKPCQTVCDIEWIQGAHMVFRKEVFTRFLFNNDFIAWSCAEDVMLSYQVHQHYGKGALQYHPNFKLIHYESKNTSYHNTQLIKMQIIYQFIFWHQCVYQHKTINLMAYLYGQLGYVKFLLGFYGRRKKTLNAIIKTYLFLFKYWREVINNKIDYNHFILQSSNT